MQEGRAWLGLQPRRPTGRVWANGAVCKGPESWVSRQKQAGKEGLCLGSYVGHGSPWTCRG